MYLAPLNYDRFYKKVFSDTEISKRFLEDFLEIEIDSIELLKEKHRVTDDAAVVEFDFRCKIGDSYIIVEVLKLLSNKTKKLDFLPKNRLIFMFQKNIIKNKKIKPYKKWFEFAERTRNSNNKEDDFKEFSGDTVFEEMMRRLNKSALTEDDIIYIEDEKEFYNDLARWEQDIYNEGKIKGKNEAKITGKQAALISLMSAKFGISEDEIELIRPVESHEKLDRVIEAVLYAETKAEILNLLK
ncbi:MAG: hypothetical protein GY754_10235 [bacterium]|nr:hypothetical protein [bacterium]